MKKALITGIMGQDGSYLSEYLVSLGYEVHGMIRRSTVFSTFPAGLYNKVYLHFGDVTDATSLDVVIRKSEPDEIYNLAGQSFVPTSWIRPEDTFNVNTSGLARILEVIHRIRPKCKVYQASSSEMFGNTPGSLNEDSPMNPVSPYGVSKLAAHKLCSVYRKLGLQVYSGILFNHESPRRGTEMVTKRISRTVAGWMLGNNHALEIGNLYAMRDWGFAGDYIKAMYAMMQGKPDDFVIGTGESHTVIEFLTEAVRCWKPNLSVNDLIAQELIIQTQSLIRSNDIDVLKADYTKAKKILDWEPTTSFKELVRIMVMADYEILKARQVGAATA